MGSLDLWNLDTTAEAVYRSCLRAPDLDEAALAVRLDLPPAAVTSALADLQRAGLVVLSSDGIHAGAPATALGALLQGELQDLEARRGRIDAVRADMAAFSADHLVGQTRGWSAVPFEVLSEPEAVVAFEELMRSTEGEVLSCHAVDELDHINPRSSYVTLVRDELAAGRPMRAVYPSSVVEDSVKLDYVRTWAAAGEQIRLLPYTTREIDVFGDQAAIVSSRWEGLSGSMILIHAPAMVFILKELFERYWERSVPFSLVSGDGEGPDRRARILELLMMGAKDESIARALNISLRTVRRRISELLDELGATTRFQAGMEAARRGLL